jgi:ribonucleoside-triphosphate reductase
MKPIITLRANKKLKPKRKIPCEVYSRVVGYLRPISGWNLAKKQEFIDRVPYKVKT